MSYVSLGVIISDGFVGPRIDKLKPGYYSLSLAWFSLYIRVSRVDGELREKDFSNVRHKFSGRKAQRVRIGDDVWLMFQWKKAQPSVLIVAPRSTSVTKNAKPPPWWELSRASDGPLTNTTHQLAQPVTTLENATKPKGVST